MSFTTEEKPTTILALILLNILLRFLNHFSPKNQSHLFLSFVLRVGVNVNSFILSLFFYIKVNTIVLFDLRTCQLLDKLNEGPMIRFDDKTLDNFIENEIDQGFPGVALLVFHNGSIVKQKAYGYRRRYDENGIVSDQPQPMTVDTMFDVASLTKIYATNYALMQLVYRGLLNVDHPVKTYLPEYTGDTTKNQCRDTRLVRDLLTHTAGYAASVEFYDPTRVSCELYSQEKSKTEQILLKSLDFQRTRGSNEMPLYSDIDFMILGLIIERISGMDIDQYVKKNIYDPLGLTHTTFNPLRTGIYQPSDFAATELQGNTRDGSIYFPNVRTKVLQGEVHDEKSFFCMNGVSGHAGLFTNLNDLSVLIQIMLNNGTFGNVQFWNEEIQNLFLTPCPSDCSFGLGWRLNKNKNLPWFGRHASEKAYGHTGWTGTCTVIDPKYSLAIILLTNKRHTRCIDGVFNGERFETGKYGKIMTLVYESMSLVDDCLKNN